MPMDRDSAVCIATRYGLDGPGDRIPVEARFFAPVQTSPGAHPASCTMGTGPFPGVKRPGRGADHPPPSKCRSHERVGLYLYSPSGPQWPVIGRTLPYWSLPTEVQNITYQRTAILINLTVIKVCIIYLWATFRPKTCKNKFRNC